MRAICGAALSLVALSVAACAPARPEAFGPMPTDYRGIVAEEIRASFFDPSSLQDVSIAYPIHGPAVPAAILEPGWIVCFRANGKNRMGAYAGRQDHAYIIRDGLVVDQNDTALRWCAPAQYVEWPEMEMVGQSRNRPN